MDQKQKEQTLLSKRELQVLTWAAHGMTYAEISGLLAMAEDTVKDHIERANRKLNTKNKTHAVAVVVARGYIKI